MLVRRLFLLAILVLQLAAVSQNISAEEQVVFVSSFAAGKEGAITSFRLNLDSGQLEKLATTGDMEHPFFMAMANDGKNLYAIHAPGTFGGKENEFVSAYEVLGKSGELKLRNRETTKGTGSCYLAIDASSRELLVANYFSGSVASLPVMKDGSLNAPASFFQHVGSSVNPERQTVARAHCFVISPDNRFAFAADLGMDQIVGYALAHDKGALTLKRQRFVRTLPGAGPRHLTFSPNGKQVYVINELLNSISRFDYEMETGNLYEHETISTLPEGTKVTSHCADLKITPNGKFLYGTNRGHDSLACYRIRESGELELIEIIPSTGKGPQNLAITPDGKWLLCANMPGDALAVFSIDETTGKLSLRGKPIAIKSPSCIQLLPKK